MDNEPPVVFVQADLERYISDSYDPSNEYVVVYNEEHDDWDWQTVQVPDEKLGGERYATLEEGSHRKRKMLVYWGKEWRSYQDVWIISVGSKMKYF